ncbi:MAG: hypothetical protein M1541_07405 [Acidobacteria bacterium]|nr:hypothetical protein [Acidobacteriota bacterium]
MLLNQRCRYISPLGRRCRANANTGWLYCQLHGDRTPDNPSAAPVVPDGDRLDTAESIHAVMARILRGQATGKFQPKHATAMMYSCQTLLLALPRLDAERERVLAGSPHGKLPGTEEDPLVERQEAK